MAIRHVGQGWRVDIQPGGRGGKRYRKTFKTKIDALRWETAVKGKVAGNPSFQMVKKDNRRLSELVTLWYDLHGINLKAAGDTYRRLLALSRALGNPPASMFTPQCFAEYRAKRIAEGLSPNTLNRERSYLAGVFGELRRLGHWEGGNPLARVRPIRVAQTELSFLNFDQINRLLSSLADSKNQDVLLIAKVSLVTGARWSEAEKLRREHVRASPGLVTFIDTKSGKNRAVPIDDSLAGELASRLDRGLFRRSYFAFRSAMIRAEIHLPDGQLAHVLRHTFASHFMMQGGNILTLQRILGHSSLVVTMRYAHLAPDHLQEVLRLNPLSALTLR